jgi:hypothetical protein
MEEKLHFFTTKGGGRRGKGSIGRSPYAPDGRPRRGLNRRFPT